MKPKVYIGIDNGVTGTIGIVGDTIQPAIYHTPIKKEQDYTKTKKSVTRLDSTAFVELLKQYEGYTVKVLCERPMINPTRWTASMSAIRCWEAQLIVFEVLGISHQFVDS